ncbi:hypothetical protein Ahy_A10g049952 isoform C [Arachis hypogaea]|uniref:Uncharacterized protein n=1 Tax=Arachis hypogaea TaxID=3818 RepID=A0A445B8A6_ARAHY|nr:hypothetical protein Ahy_A10g049952 isoform C [Arachis hypogaea]
MVGRHHRRASSSPFLTHSATAGHSNRRSYFLLLLLFFKHGTSRIQPLCLSFVEQSKLKLHHRRASLSFYSLQFWLAYLRASPSSVATKIGSAVSRGSTFLLPPVRTDMWLFIGEPLAMLLFSSILNSSVSMGSTEIPSQSTETIKIPTAIYEFGATFIDHPKNID